MLGGASVVPRPPQVCLWKEEFLPAIHPGAVVGSPSLVAASQRWGSIFQEWRSTILHEELPYSPTFPRVLQPAAAPRDAPRTGREQPSWLPAGRE